MNRESTVETLDRAQARNRTPIPTRRMEFDFDAVQERFWYGGNGLMSAVLSGLSATFPNGEKEFVRSVMYYRDQITDPVLRDQMRAFAAQEGHHAHQHRLANAWLDSKGFDASGIEDVVEKNIEKFLSTSEPPVHLAMTVMFEHITAILAEYMLTQPEAMAPMPEPIRELLTWHAIEEIEHKAVAFDVYEAVSGDRDLLRRVGAFATAFFLVEQTRHALVTLRALEHLPTPREVAGTGRFFFGKRGLITKAAKTYLEFFRSDFHPWDNDNRELITKWMESHQAAA